MTLHAEGSCPYCSSTYQPVVHTGPCPRVKSIEYHPNGSVKKVEFIEDKPQIVQGFR